MQSSLGYVWVCNKKRHYISALYFDNDTENVWQIWLIYIEFDDQYIEAVEYASWYPNVSRNDKEP